MRNSIFIQLWDMQISLDIQAMLLFAGAYATGTGRLVFVPSVSGWFSVNLRTYLSDYPSPIRRLPISSYSYLSCGDRLRENFI